MAGSSATMYSPLDGDDDDGIWSTFVGGVVVPCLAGSNLSWPTRWDGKASIRSVSVMISIALLGDALSANDGAVDFIGGDLYVSGNDDDVPIWVVFVSIDWTLSPE